MFDVTAFGEALIDFTARGKSEQGNLLFEQNPGGAPANLACAVSRLGGKSAFIGKVGQDMQGKLIKDTLKSCGVDVLGLKEDPEVFTTLAFVAVGEDGERSFSFARKPGADTCLRPQEVEESRIEGAKVFAFGSLSLCARPSRDATLYALEKARAAGCIIAYDPNYRPALWPGEEEAARQMRTVLPFADVVKLSEEETALLAGAADPQTAAARLVKGGAKAAVVTLGAKGAWVQSREGGCHVPGFKAGTVDATGAGDAFWGAFLLHLAQSGRRPEELPLEHLAQMARYANAAASLCVESWGAIPALPDATAVEARLKETQ